MKSEDPNWLEIQSLSGYFVTLQPGRITMRDDRIKKVWDVEIARFNLAKYPVTQQLFRAVMNTSPSTFKGDNLPVETVSWKEAINFCNQLSENYGRESCYLTDLETGEVVFVPQANGFRLPTEAEWQYACQAGLSTSRYGDLDSISWYKANSEESTHDVGQKTPNQWGLYDMLGNVWEWCTDIYDESVYGSYRVFRGGGWSDQERSVMATTRRRSHPSSFKIDDLGFRIATNQAE